MEATQFDVPSPSGRGSEQPLLRWITFILNANVSSTQEPTTTEVVRSRFPINGTEQVYTRKTKASPEWKPLDIGWFSEGDEKSQMVLIKNLDGFDPRSLQGNPPTPEEEALLATRYILLRHKDSPDHGAISIRPGFLAVFDALEASEWVVRSSGAPSVRFSVTAFPA